MGFLFQNSRAPDYNNWNWIFFAVTACLNSSKEFSFAMRQESRALKRTVNASLTMMASPFIWSIFIYISLSLRFHRIWQIYLIIWSVQILFQIEKKKQLSSFQPSQLKSSEIPRWFAFISLSSFFCNFMPQYTIFNAIYFKWIFYRLIVLVSYKFFCQSVTNIKIKIIIVKHMKEEWKHIKYSIILPLNMCWILLKKIVFLSLRDIFLHILKLVVVLFEWRE